MPTPGIWITAIMTRPSGANMPQRKVNRPKWQYRYRQCHPSEPGGSQQRHDNNWLYISHSGINYGILSASFSDAQKSKWAGSALKGQDAVYDRLSPNQTNCTNTLPSLFIQEVWRFFFLPRCALFIMLHEGNFFSVVDMRGCWLFHVEHGAAIAGSLGTHCEYQVLWRVQQALLIHMHPWSHTQ